MRHFRVDENSEPLFKRFGIIAQQLQNQSSIVQNQGLIISMVDLVSWANNINAVIDSLTKLRDDTLIYFRDREEVIPVEKQYKFFDERR